MQVVAHQHTNGLQAVDIVENQLNDGCQGNAQYNTCQSPDITSYEQRKSGDEEIDLQVGAYNIRGDQVALN